LSVRNAFILYLMTTMIVEDIFCITNNQVFYSVDIKDNRIKKYQGVLLSLASFLLLISKVKEPNF
jgi:hypothetical protein